MNAYSITAVSEAIQTKAVPNPCNLGTSSIVSIVHVIIPKIPALTTTLSCFIGIRSCNTMICSIPITKTCAMMTRISNIAGSNPFPANIDMMSGDKNSTYMTTGIAMKNSIWNAILYSF